MKSRPFEEGLIEQLRDDSELQAEYIKCSFEENHDMPEAIEVALSHVAKARSLPRPSCFIDVCRLVDLLGLRMIAKPYIPIRFEISGSEDLKIIGNQG